MSWIIQKPYARLIEFCIRWRYVTVAAGIAVLLLTMGIWASGKIKFTFFPKVEGDVIQCMITMPVGTPLARTREVVASIETAGKDVIAEQDQARPADAPPLMEYSANLIGAQFGRRGVSESGGTWPRSGFSFWKGKNGMSAPPELNRRWRERVGLIADSESLIFQAKSTARETPLRSISPSMIMTCFSRQRMISKPNWKKFPVFLISAILICPVKWKCS
ncbi:MAG: hypothetical protein R2860_10860 [Desulfobacterales bacterium]